MTDLTSFFKTNLIDDHVAEDINVLIANALRAEYTNTETISATKELSDLDCPFQVLTASGADRDVELAQEATTNHVTVVYNTSPSNSVLVKDDSGAVTFVTLAPDQWAMFVPISGETWKVLLGKEAAASYVLYAASDTFSPVDAVTYYIGNQFSNTPSGTALRRKAVIPRTGTIKRADIIMICTVGTSEISTMSLRLNNTTDTILSSAIDLSANPFEVLGIALNIPVVAGDFFEIKWVSPTWATNPVGVSITVQLFIE